MFQPQYGMEFGDVRPQRPQRFQPSYQQYLLGQQPTAAVLPQRPTPRPLQYGTVATGGGVTAPAGPGVPWAAQQGRPNWGQQQPMFPMPSYMRLPQYQRRPYFNRPPQASFGLMPRY